jgi:hypothetical protein
MRPSRTLTQVVLLTEEPGKAMLMPGQGAIQVIGYRFGDGQHVLTSISRSVTVRPSRLPSS